MSNKESWHSRIGFMMAAAGSAVGLANIWRFPYMVGSHGGSIFVILYLICLLLIGIPVFIAEILIGRETQLSPSGAFRKLGKGRVWPLMGKFTIITGFLVSSFYSAVAGWILGYLVEAVQGKLTLFSTGAQALDRFNTLVGSPIWAVGFHLLFMAVCVAVLLFGVKRGIERSSKVMMPALYILLILLVVRGLTLPGASKGLQFLLKPDWSEATPMAILTALGQAFFTLSLGQGTMVTYGSYLRHKDNIVTSCLPVVAMDTLVSLFAAVAVMTIVFSAGLAPSAGPALLFETLPFIFSKMTGGYFLALGFFLLVLLAAISSQISALEPTIAYLVGEKRWHRRPATLLAASASFAVGIPSALSFGVMRGWTIGGSTFFDLISNLCTDIMIPLGGLLAVILVGWIWGVKSAIKGLRRGAEEMFDRFGFLRRYFWFCFKIGAPSLIVVVFLHAVGVL